MAISVKPAAPALFTGVDGQAAALDPDGLAISAQHPALPGSFISVFFTGQGPVNADVDDGDAPDAGKIVQATSPISATIGGVAADVQFTGLAPGLPGVAQINLKIPTLATGVYPTSPASEIEYLLALSDAPIIICEDQEQLDKVLRVRERLPKLQQIIVIDPRGLRHYDRCNVHDFDAVLDLGRQLEARQPRTPRMLVHVLWTKTFWLGFSRRLHLQTLRRSIL